MTLCLAMVAALAAPALAQTGGISGTLTDETGAVLPGVEIRALLRDESGETTRSVVTDGAGRYQLNGLTPGNWTITASLPGFETSTLRPTMRVGDAQDWSPTLELGTIMETISITQTATDEPLRREAQSPPSGAGAGVTPAPRAAAAGVVRVGGNVKPPQKIVDVRPVYPADAVAQNVGGVVILKGIIAIDGTVRDVTALRSPNESLTQAATNALTGWEFRPTLLNGLPVPTRINAVFNFSHK